VFQNPEPAISTCHCVTRLPAAVEDLNEDEKYFIVKIPLL
jgi:hypothetical protein